MSDLFGGDILQVFAFFEGFAPADDAVVRELVGGTGIEPVTAAV
jgi:hypothetical protein